MLLRGWKRTDAQDRFLWEAWQQKPAHPSLREKQAGLQEVEKIRINRDLRINKFVMAY